MTPRRIQAYLKGRYDWNKAHRRGLRAGVDVLPASRRPGPQHAVVPVLESLNTYNVLGGDDIQAPGNTRSAGQPGGGARVGDRSRPRPKPMRRWGYVLLFNDGADEEAAREMRKAIELNPSLHVMAHQLVRRNLLAERTLRRDRGVAASCWWNCVSLSMIIDDHDINALFLLGRDADARSQIDKTLELDIDDLLGILAGSAIFTSTRDAPRKRSRPWTRKPS